MLAVCVFKDIFQYCSLQKNTIQNTLRFVGEVSEVHYMFVNMG